MKRGLLSTRRQRRTLVIPKPGRKGNIKITREGWLNCARVGLIEEGIDGLKVDRLAKRLKVTRGGFYYHFKNLHQLVQELLMVWKAQNRFTPAKVDASTPQSAVRAFDRISEDLVHENGFDPQFDMAVREWARISQPVADVVHQVDDERIEILRQIFLGIGYEPKEALIRARIFYWHQIGYYAVGVREPLQAREQNLRIYLNVLAGEKYQSSRA